MRAIKEITCQMLEEIKSSIDYSCSAIDYKVSNPQLAELYHKMASTEFQHAKSLHEYAVKMVEDIREKGMTPTQEMLDEYDKKHKKYIKLAEKAQSYYNLY